MKPFLSRCPNEQSPERWKSPQNKASLRGIDPCDEVAQQEEMVKSPSVIVGGVLALVVGVTTGSARLLACVIAGASLLLVVGELVRRAVRRYAGLPIRSSRTGWLDVNDRETA